MQKERLENLLKEAARGASSGAFVAMDTEALTILMDYSNDIADRVLESAAIFAQSRGAAEISEQDIALILGILPKAIE